MEATDRSRRVFHFGPFIADMEARSLYKQTRRILLQDQPFQVLAMLLARPGELVTRDELRQSLWASNTFVDFDHGLNIAINKLRRALGDSADEPRYIQTVPRRGYRFIAPLSQPPEVTAVTSTVEPPASAERAVDHPAGVAAGRPARRKKKWAIALMGITGATLLALYAAGVKDRTLDTVQGDSISSLAVLPLENLSRDPAQDYFADGMTDELITTLAKLQSVKVISRSSVVRYKGTTRSLADIARELKVDGIIEGTVLHSGNRVRITVQLVRAAVDQHIWAETYDGNVQDVIKLQDAIARAVAAEIRVKLNPTQQARMNNSKSVDPAAYEAYLRGRYLSYSRWSKESDAAAAHYYEEAMAKDPGYAPAYSGLADYYTFKGFEQQADRADAVKAKDLAAKALKLDAGLADGHIAMANALYRIDWNWAEAEKEFRKGIELNPDAPNSYFCYALYLGVLGRHEEAIAAMRRAIELDPFSATMNTGLGIVLQWSGQNEQAVMQARKAIALDPLLADAHSVLARADEQLGRYDEAIAEYSESDRLSGIDPSTVADFKRIYMNSGINGYRRKKLDWEMQRIGSGEANYFNMAKLAADLGEKDVAFQWLEKTFQQHDVVIVNIKVASSLRSLHGDSRFSDLVRRVGLP